MAGTITPGRLRATGIASLLLALLCAAVLTTEANAKRPNIVAIVTDDQSTNQFNRAVMPKTFKKIVDRGINFSQAVVTTPQCCPSRAAMLTGQYSHNNGVISNTPGYPLLRRKSSILPRWLSRSGYRTIHIGKYLNGYNAAKVDPAWDRWLSLAIPDYVDPVLSVDGKRRPHPGTYVTSLIERLSSKEIRRSSKQNRPFYLQIDHVAPHVGGGDEGGRCSNYAIPDPADGDLYAGTKAPRTPNFDEADASDKPDFIQNLPRLLQPQRERIDLSFSCGLASLRAVDRSVGALVRKLRQTGELKRTMIVFFSDNGYSFGRHRVPLTKGLAYEEHVRVPFAVRPPAGFPRKVRGAVSPAAIAGIDLAPTFLELARATPCLKRECRTLDGRSLVPILEGDPPDWARQRAVGIEFSINAPAYKYSCSFDAYRTRTETVIRHTSLAAPGTGLCTDVEVFESYDNVADPFQLDSIAPTPDQIRKLDRVAECAGIPGRDRRVDGRPFCL